MAELSASEQAYFESGGQTEVVETPPEITNDAPQGDLAASSEIVQEQGTQTEQTEQRDEKGRFVPHQALHAEREERKKLQVQLEELRTKSAVLEDRWNTILKVGGEQQKPQAEAPPDPNEDIFAYAKWQGEQMKALTEKINSREVQETQQQQVAAQEREIWGHWSQSAQSYAAEKPDFGDAVKHLSEARTNQLRAMAAVDPRFGTEDGVLGQINAELRSIVAAAREKGQDPAEVVYGLAKAYGFQAPAGAVAPNPGATELSQKLQQIDAAQNASRTLAASNGKTAGDPLSAEAIVSMSPEAFAQWHKDPANVARFEKILKGG